MKNELIGSDQLTCKSRKSIQLNEGRHVSYFGCMNVFCLPQIGSGLGSPGSAFTQNPQRDGEHATGPWHAHHNQVRTHSLSYAHFTSKVLLKLASEQGLETPSCEAVDLQSNPVSHFTHFYRSTVGTTSKKKKKRQDLSIVTVF